MISVTVALPEERVPDFYQVLAALLGSHAGQTSEDSADWTPGLAQTALARLLDPEKDLLHRIVDARGRRVPLTELSRDLGLPQAAAVEQDFSALAKFCVEQPQQGGKRLLLPVIAGGSGDAAWYWMSPRNCVIFQGGFMPPEPPAQPEAESDPPSSRARSGRVASRQRHTQPSRPSPSSGRRAARQ